MPYITPEIPTQFTIHRDIHPNTLLDEGASGGFLGMSARWMQAARQKGDGPKFVKISARCIRYRLGDLIAWQEFRLRNNTAQG